MLEQATQEANPYAFNAAYRFDIISIYPVLGNIGASSPQGLILKPSKQPTALKLLTIILNRVDIEASSPKKAYA